MANRALAVTAALLSASAFSTSEGQADFRPDDRQVPGLEESVANLVLPALPPAAMASPAPPPVPPPVAFAPPPAKPVRASASRNAPNRPRRTARSGDVLARIRECESGSNYQARSSSGRYGGAYQMDRRTFASVGGTGDPAMAPRAEQDYRARLLYQQRGSRPWPVCSSRA